MAVAENIIVISRDYLMAQRQALLLELDALERLLAIVPRTAEIRKAAKTVTPPPQYNCEMEFEREQKEGSE